jgi:hypothetical protein
MTDLKTHHWELNGIAEEPPVTPAASLIQRSLDSVETNFREDFANICIVNKMAIDSDIIAASAVSVTPLIALGETSALLSIVSHSLSIKTLLTTRQTSRAREELEASLLREEFLPHT